MTNDYMYQKFHEGAGQASSFAVFARSLTMLTHDDLFSSSYQTSWLPWHWIEKSVFQIIQLHVESCCPLI